jgi:hypothetical protein
MTLFAEFAGAVARWLLTMAGAYLIAHHVLTADQADRFSSAVVEHLMMAVPVLIPLVWSCFQKYRNRIKFLTALEASPGTTEATIEARVKNGAGAALTVAVLAVAGLQACAVHQQPPAGTYSPAGTRAFNADQLLRDLQAVSQTAINLNAQTGKLHLSDADTALVRDFALSAGAALASYGTGGSTLAQIRDAYFALMRNLSVDGKQHPQLAGALMAIGIALNAVT